MSGYLIKDTTKEEREQIASDVLGYISASCDGCMRGLVEMSCGKWWCGGLKLLLSLQERVMQKTCKTIIRRCSILLALDENASAHLTQIQIAKSYGVSKATVSNIVRAYVDGGIQAITAIKRNPNSNARRKADGRMEAEIIRIACGPAPEGRCRWTLRFLEKQVRLELDEPVGRETIRRVLKKTNSAPT